ncbi:alpha/beta hydrolase [Aeromicrobium sp. CF3.5]|uniref:alpha/beta hydrolase n=1 Tax=Aeromicrobium sp. CF3.5 TaxID=3373078 RepID=UPI003EE6E2FE
MAGPRPGQPRLDSYVRLDEPRAAVLLLHGGQQNNTEPVENKHASWWRMALLARSLRRFARREGFDLDLLQYRLRGWNGPTDPSPVGDARWALDRIRERHPGVPIVLVGHSMGGRTACRVADAPGVLGVVGMAPWLPEGEPVSALAGSSLHVLHGTADRWTSARASKDFVDRSESIARSVSWQSLPGAGHFMFRQVSAWREFVESSIDRILGESA